MEPTFRQSMNWLHTWAGVVVGSLCFAIFWMGTLSVFDREIDRWMMPATRLPSPAAVGLDGVVPAMDRIVRETRSPQWYATLPTERVPTLVVGYRDVDGNFQRRHADPRTGALLPDQGTLGGTGFIFPFHFHLHLNGFWQIGYWLVGLAGMAMMALCVSGVVIHKRIFSDFFLMRVGKTQRTALDLHNVTGVLGLPFHFVISFSGLIIFLTIYFPSAWNAGYGDRQAFSKEAFGSYSRPAAGVPAATPPASLDGLTAEAVRLWGEGQAYFVRVWRPGDQASYVEVRRSYDSAVSMNLDTVHFDAQSGAVLQQHRASPVVGVQRFIAGLHFIQFRHWTLRWIYFGLGLAGCLLIATGFVFWLESRRKRHARLGLRGVLLVEGLTIGSVTGIIIATLGFLIANRLLPLGAGLGDTGRASLEMWAFYLIWTATFVHAGLRPGRQAWHEQTWAIAGLALLAVTLNATTTGDHVAHALAHPHLWGVAGVDLTLIAVSFVAALSARALGSERSQMGPLSARPQPAE